MWSDVWAVSRHFYYDFDCTSILFFEILIFVLLLLYFDFLRGRFMSLLVSTLILSWLTRSFFNSSSLVVFYSQAFSMLLFIIMDHLTFFSFGSFSSFFSGNIRFMTVFCLSGMQSFFYLFYNNVYFLLFDSSVYLRIFIFLISNFFLSLKWFCKVIRSFYDWFSSFVGSFSGFCLFKNFSNLQSIVYQ